MMEQRSSLFAPVRMKSESRYEGISYTTGDLSLSVPLTSLAEFKRSKDRAAADELRVQEHEDGH